MRITPGLVPAAEVPSTTMKSEAEHFVSAHIAQENYKEISRGAELERLKTIIGRLTAASGYPPRTFPIHLVDAGNDVNAAAFNGASIVVYRELLRRVPDDDELATVLAHEIGHIIGKHYKDEAEEKRRAEVVSVGSSVLGSIASIATSAAGYGGASDMAGSATETAAGAIGYGAFVGSFSRTQEYEADHIGLLVMAKAGYNPEKAIVFWSRADEIFGSGSSSVGAFFSTHPASKDRLNAIREAMPYALPNYAAADKAKAAISSKKWK